VFTAFGYAAFWAFMWEVELAALALTIKKIRCPSLGPVELDQYDAKLRRERTAGALIKGELGEFLKGQRQLKHFVEKVTESRNLLIHRIYEEQVPNLNSKGGRQRAINEIELVATELKEGSILIRNIYMALARASFRDVDKILNNVTAEALKRWSD
jgi:hypothetical protein